MALDRSTLRDELVAVIAAGRELSPEYDYHLADIYLDVLLRRPRSQPRPARLLDDPRWLPTLIGAVCLALAVLAFTLPALHAGAAMNRSMFVPRMYDPDRYYDRHDLWRYEGNPPPWSPSTSFPPGR